MHAACAPAYTVCHISCDTASARAPAKAAVGGLWPAGDAKAAWAKAEAASAKSAAAPAMACFFEARREVRRGDGKWGEGGEGR